MARNEHIDSQQITVVRRFNRAYTQRIGALDESFLGMGLPLSAMRLIYEIGTGTQPVTVHALRTRLSLDSGYLSRLLRRLEDGGLVALSPDPADGRRRVVVLTRKGTRRWQELEARSEARARTLLAPLTPRQRERLISALAEADLLVRAATVTFDDVDPASAPARAAVARYFDEIHDRFGFEFDGLDAKDAESLSPPHGTFVLALSDGLPVACGGVQTVGDGTGEIKRMWVDDAWRGAGLGSRLLRELEAHVASMGHRRVVLDTNAALVEAIAMYEHSGYRAIERYNDNPWATHFFEKSLS
jgi:DNA-binding MarR family transcriptional regulator/N-acetylglutamate synthase-like GNAT family acetyltransferase